MPIKEIAFKLSCSQGNREAPDKHYPSAFPFSSSRYEQLGPILHQMTVKLILKTLGLQSQWCLLISNELLIRIVHKNNDTNAKLFLDNYHLKQGKASSFGAVSAEPKPEEYRLLSSSSWETFQRKAVIQNWCQPLAQSKGQGEPPRLPPDGLSLQVPQPLF